ncbi:hypothetical protein CRENBAI_010747 [Crenichthys baileyi]|uniref:IMD domain-containing protein n=1 Tax=Crenichthys baileyi TaxID=28760 RepID=A0AAV9RUV4_9TELE
MPVAVEHFMCGCVCLRACERAHACSAVDGLDGCTRGAEGFGEIKKECSYPVWEDFSAKATKLHSQLRTTVLAAVAFLDAFQKVADMATNTRAGHFQSEQE